MDEHINRFIQRHSLSVGHGQEAEAHADIEPLAHAGSVEGLRLFLGARPLVLLGLTHSCKNKKRRRVDSLKGAFLPPSNPNSLQKRINK